MDQSLERQLTKAKFQLISEQPFFGYLLLSLKCEISTNLPYKSMGVDGKKLYIDPDFAAKLKMYEWKFCLAHEILHMVYKHHLRTPVKMTPKELNERLNQGKFDEIAEVMYKHMKYNTAGDLVINAVLKNDFKMKFPREEVIKPLYTDKYRDDTKWYTEAVYRDIPDPECPKCGKSKGKQPDQGGCGCGQGQGQQRVRLRGIDKGSYYGNNGDVEGDVIGEVFVEGGKKMSKAEEAKAEADLDTKIIQAANHAKKQGKLPANMERYVSGLTEYSVDYKELLRQFLERALTRSDYDWRMPNKRYACQQGVYLPSLWGEDDELHDAVIAVDTSGSMSQQELTIISGHLSHMLELFNLNLHLIYCDTAIANTEVLSREDIQDDGLHLQAKGGGGTDFKPPFEYIEEKGIEPRFLIYFTDLCCNSFPEEPRFPVFWGYLKGAWGYYGNDANQQHVPFGEVVEIDVSEAENA